MANKGIPINQSEHASELKDTYKIPISDGSGKPKHITLYDIKKYLDIPGLYFTLNRARLNGNTQLA